MKSIIDSAKFFIIGTIKHGYFILFALFLDPIDIYTRLKPTTWPELPIPNSWVWAAFLLTLFFSIFVTYHNARMAPAPTDRPRLPLLKIRDYCAQRGWDFSGASLDSMDLIDALVQSAIDADIEIWGRQDGFGKDKGASTRAEPLTQIDIEHFRDYKIDPLPLVNSETNRNLYTFRPGTVNGRQGGYNDLHVTIYSLKNWESKANKEFLGRTKKLFPNPREAHWNSFQDR